MFMADLAEREKSLIWALLEKSEAQRHTRGRFRTVVSDELDRLDIAPERRELIFEFACQRADNSAALVSDTIELATVEDARRTLKDSAARLALKSWCAAVRDRWPAPIAHEIERLFDEMQGRRFASGERVDPSVDSALLQLKDAFEALIKFTATVLMRGLIETDRERSDWARRQLFRRGLFLGHWTGMLRDAVSRYKDGVSVFAPLAALARASRRKLLAWISAARHSPHKKLARMPIFRIFSAQSCYAKWCADSSISLRLLAHRLLDSGHFGALRGEKTLRTGSIRTLIRQTAEGIFLSRENPLALGMLG
jgi:hypothetical protein